VIAAPLRRPLTILAVVGIAALTALASARACPFCTAPRATISQRRETAEIVALIEWASTDKQHERMRVLKLLKSPAGSHPEQLDLPADRALRTSGLWLALGRPAADGGPALEWETLAVDEMSAAYIVRAPSTRLPVGERLKYFCRFLENPDALVADDAYAEFGRAPFDEVAKLSELLPMDSMRRWLDDPGVPELRKGFYGMALGLASNSSERAANTACLEQLLRRPASDFRSGFDGLLAGYLLLDGEKALAEIERRWLIPPGAPLGDVLHAMTALRFYHEYGRAIGSRRLAAALAHLIQRPEVAPQAIIDLARWQAWECLPQVVAAAKPAAGDEPLGRAIVGYLLLCPSAEAAEPLAAWRRSAPGLVAEVQRGLSPISRE
jgi:hypothetical protein